MVKVNSPVGNLIQKFDEEAIVRGENPEVIDHAASAGFNLDMALMNLNVFEMPTNILAHYIMIGHKEDGLVLGLAKATFLRAVVAPAKGLKDLLIDAPLHGVAAGISALFQGRGEE